MDVTTASWLDSPDLGQSDLGRGRRYAGQGRAVVEDVWQADDGHVELTGVAYGSRGRPYRQHVDMRRVAGRPRVAGECGCPVGFNCKHVVALIATWERSRPAASSHSRAPATRTAADGPTEKPVAHDARDLSAVWYDVLANVEEAALGGGPPPTTHKRMVYVLDVTDTRSGALVTAQSLSVTKRKDGGWGADAKPYHVGQIRNGRPKFVTAEDAEILRMLASAGRPGGGGTSSYGLDGPLAGWLVERMLATGRLYWRDHRDGPPLVAGGARPARALWETQADGTQRFTLQPVDDGEQAPVVLPIDPPYYIDPARGTCGELETDVTASIAARLLRAPGLGPAEAAAFRERAERLGGVLPKLPRAPTRRVQKQVKPTPVLRCIRSRLMPGGGRAWKAAFQGGPDGMTVGELLFDYGGRVVSANDSDERLQWLEDDVLVRVPRARTAETGRARELEASGFERVYRQARVGVYETPPTAYARLTDTAAEDADAWLAFLDRERAAFERAGWRVEFGADFPYHIKRPDADGWSVSIHESSGTDWFSMALGIDVDGERLDLLPILRAFLQQTTMGESGPEPAEDEVVDLPRGGGEYLALPAARLIRIARALRGLYDRASAAGPIELAASQLGELEAVDRAAAEDGITVHGSERLRGLAKSLRDGCGITATPVPAGFQGELRAYQLAGLDWLQTLARHGFGGVLADDMGLGKTIQALAHVLAEKEAGRLDRPCLLVCPTSVVWNWKNEAACFAPDLRVLVLHGADRSDRFAEIAEHDLVLTTYALLPRDGKHLAAHSYAVLFLDEAQNVKNPDAQAAKLLRGYTVRQAVCLTGTPVENHLGELWSLMRLTVPGLLGDRTGFRKHFRTPIEKHGDADRRADLARRVRPFLLRRTKVQVAEELPPRTETTQTVQLDGAQRDLYETVRLAMDKRVRDEIRRHGVARSQIMVLDALLKLRQTCCDPRLLNMDAARGVTRSAKLERLAGMLADLVAEGRQAIVFSQFATMIELIAQRLEAAGLTHVTLTGNTRDRRTPVERFQAGAAPIFLISLKAGGTGLNLTAADTVIHYDPWWNPAVEAQAADRAYRIGQDKPVFVYKMIAEGTVEERIVDMQARKRDIAALVQTAEEGGGSAFSEADVDALLAPIGEAD
jgi:superfamily II DNA or RNA helicase